MSYIVILMSFQTIYSINYGNTNFVCALQNVQLNCRILDSRLSSYYHDEDNLKCY